MRACVLAMVAFLVASDVQASSPQGWEPVDGAPDLLAWFHKLNREFQDVVENEKTGQLLRKVDRVRKDLYAVELDSKQILMRVPEKPPTSAERETIRKLVRSLLGSVRSLAVGLNQFGADLRLKDPDEEWKAEHRLTYGLHTRGITLTYIETQLEVAATQPALWSASEIKMRLTGGIAALVDAQKALMDFQRRLQAKPPKP